MNREVKDWRCPNCDTMNIGRRCVICGTEKPEERIVVSEKQEEKPKKPFSVPRRMLMIYGIIIVVFLIITGIFLGNKGNQEEFIETIDSHEIEIKPEIDNRYSEEEIVSHSGDRIPCIAIKHAKDILKYVDNDDDDDLDR